jgi:hypothetical protein
VVVHSKSLLRTAPIFRSDGSLILGDIAKTLKEGDRSVVNLDLNTLIH